MTTSSLENLLERMLRNLASHLIAEFSRNRGSMDLFQSSSMFCPFPVKDCKQAVTSKCFTTFTPLYTFPSVKLTTVTEKKKYSRVLCRSYLSLQKDIQMIFPSALAKEWKINVSNWKLKARRLWETFYFSQRGAEIFLSKLHEFTAKNALKRLVQTFSWLKLFIWT